MTLPPDTASLPAAPSARPFCPKAQRRYVLTAAILASALGFIDGSVLAVALPAIRLSLGAGLAEARLQEIEAVVFVNEAFSCPR